MGSGSLTWGWVDPPQCYNKAGAAGGPARPTTAPARFQLFSGRARRRGTRRARGRVACRNVKQFLEQREKTERREIARHLHDQAAQAMAGVLLGLHVLERDLRPGSHTQAARGSERRRARHAGRSSPACGQGAPTIARRPRPAGGPGGDGRPGKARAAHADAPLYCRGLLHGGAGRVVPSVARRGRWGLRNPWRCRLRSGCRPGSPLRGSGFDHGAPGATVWQLVARLAWG